MRSFSLLWLMVLAWFAHVERGGAQTDLRLSEFMAKNVSALADGNGQFNDWVEIWNPTAAAKNTSGYYLTDDRNNLTKWPFPARSLAADGRMVIFCSGQPTTGYVDPAGNPHANFSLATEGEYLALVAPDGVTVLSEFFPNYPAQLADISYGLGSTANHVPEAILGPGAPMTYRVPMAAIGGWQQTAFSDITWTGGNFPAGYAVDGGAVTTAYTLPANTPGDQSFGGSLGMDFDVTQPVTISELGCFDAGGDGIASGTITVRLYARNNHGTPSDPEDDTGGAVLATTTFTETAPGTLDGGHRFKTITPLVLPVGSYTIAADGYNASERLHNAGSVSPAVTTHGSNGALTFVRSRYGPAGGWPTSVDKQIAQYGAGTFKFVTNSGSAFATDLKSAMQNVNASVYLRAPFTPAAGTKLVALGLTVTYNDGFVAFLNGTEIARRNAPATPDFNSASTRTAKLTETIDVSSFADLVLPGQTNVLAIQGLNASAGDDDFLIDAQLSGERGIDTLVYFTTPTPGAANGSGVTSPSVVINEIHSDPIESKSYPTEFIELYNPAPTAVDVSGWAFDKGVTFTFPQGTSIGPRSYLVIAADPAMVLARLGAAALGPWTGGLANEGETVRLVDATGQTIDSVAYGLGFPWPTVGDDPGPSLQLVNEGLDRNLGGSWRAAAPTPGKVNSVAAFFAPPSVEQVAHSPLMPVSNTVVTVTAKVTDPDGVQDVALEYQIVEPGNYIRLTDAAFASNWTSMAMTDAGTGGDVAAGDAVFTAQIPAGIQTHRRLIRYRVVATDATGRVVRVPLATEPCPNFSYFVYDGVPAWTGAVQPGATASKTYTAAEMGKVRPWHLLSQAADVQTCQYDASDNDGTYHFEGALVFNGRVYDHVVYRIKGQNSTYNTGKNKWKFKSVTGQDFEMPDDYGHETTTVRTLNISSVPAPWAPWNRGLAGLDEVMQFRLSNLAGVSAPKTSYLQLRVIDHASEFGGDQYGGDLWGLYLAFENQDNQFKKGHGLPDGNIFRMQVTGDGNSLLGQGDGQPDDLSDLNAFVSSSTGYRKGTPGNLASIQPEAWWRSNVDLQRYFSWRSVNEAVNNTDIRDQENVAYFRDPVSGRWHIQPWDCDLLYEQLDRWGPLGTQNTSAFEQIRRCLEHPAINIEFQNRARELQDLLLNADQSAKLVDEYVSIITAETPRVIANGAAIDPGFVEVDRRRWDYCPVSNAISQATGRYGNFYKTPYPIPNMGRGPAQPFFRSLASPDFAGQVKWVKDFIASDPSGGGRLARYALGQIDSRTLADTGVTVQIPDTPVITYAGVPGYPADGLIFQTSAFSSPNAKTFSAMEWRIAECSWPGLTGFVAGKPWRYEVQTTYDSGEISTFAPQFTFPSGVIKSGATYRVRVKMKDSDGRWSHWSAPLEIVATAPALDVYQSLAISEVMYKPPGDSDGEFIALTNLSATATLDLSPLQFTSGITCTFPAGTQLAPGARAVIIKKKSAFQAQFPGVPYLKVWDSGSLANEGERLTLSYGASIPLLSFTYGIAAPWPDLNGVGGSIVLKIPSGASIPPDPTVPTHWRSSVSIHGSPASSDAVRFSGNPSDDLDHDGLSALMEYALGTSDTSVQGPRPWNLVSAAGLSGSHDFTFQRALAADDVKWALEASTDLVTWTPANGTLVASQTLGGIITETRRFAASPGSPRFYVRIRITRE